MKNLIKYRCCQKCLHRNLNFCKDKGCSCHNSVHEATISILKEHKKTFQDLGKYDKGEDDEESLVRTFKLRFFGKGIIKCPAEECGFPECAEVSIEKHLREIITQTREETEKKVRKMMAREIGKIYKIYKNKIKDGYPTLEIEKQEWTKGYNQAIEQILNLINKK